MTHLFVALTEMIYSHCICSMDTMPVIEQSREKIFSSVQKIFQWKILLNS